jgi:hypothetical protein
VATLLVLKKWRRNFLVKTMVLNKDEENFLNEAVFCQRRYAAKLIRIWHLDNCLERMEEGFLVKKWAQQKSWNLGWQLDNWFF